jgi:GDPmannose 4,6-dehydratase
MATVIVTGITGQDGRYLAEQLLGNGDRVVGVVGTGRAHVRADGKLADEVEVIEWDFTDGDALAALLRAYRPAQFYNLAAYTTGAGMYDDPVAIGEINGISVARMLQAIERTDPGIRFCQASSSEMFGAPAEVPQSETTAFRPLSPYGAAKLFAHTAVGAYRARRGLFACSAILYNHESPRRGDAFVTRKIAKAVARIARGIQGELFLGSLEARRDWGYAPDYVRAMRLMLDHEPADDYIVATGETHSVGEFCEAAFAHAGLDYREYVKERPALIRQEARAPLAGDASKARTVLGWTPEVDFRTLVGIMVDAELAATDIPDSTS